MKFRTFTLLILSVFSVSLMAQTEAVVKQGSTDPVIDGIIDDVWAEADPVNILLPFEGDAPRVPTLGNEGETYWKMLWTETGIWLMINVTDDVYFPNWKDDPPGANDWQYDKPEVYFDVNYEKIDGGGCQSGDAGNNGHYQFAPGQPEDIIDGTP
jgi:hypothetical protein